MAQWTSKLTMIFLNVSPYLYLSVLLQVYIFTSAYHPFVFSFIPKDLFVHLFFSSFSKLLHTSNDRMAIVQKCRKTVNKALNSFSSNTKKNKSVHILLLVSANMENSKFTRCGSPWLLDLKLFSTCIILYNYPKCRTFSENKIIYSSDATVYTYCVFVCYDELVSQLANVRVALFRFRNNRELIQCHEVYTHTDTHKFRAEFV